jgi:hypothetical protein
MVAVQDSVNVGRLAVLGIAGIIAIYALVVAIQALYLAGAETQRKTKVLAVPYAEAEAAIEAQSSTLGSFGVVSVGDSGEVVHLPLDLAKTRVLEELR